jgi:hypothetical protein
MNVIARHRLVRAGGVAAGEAQRARVARNDGRHEDLAAGERLERRRRGLDNAGDFVPEDERQWMPGADSATEEGHVRMADAAAGDAHNHLAAIRLAEVELLEREAPGSGEKQAGSPAHRATPCAPTRGGVVVCRQSKGRALRNSGRIWPENRRFPADVWLGVGIPSPGRF